MLAARTRISARRRGRLRERLGAPLPRFVLEELEGYLDCGRLAAAMSAARIEEKLDALRAR